MKKELFVRMCEFQFPIMNRIMEITDCKTYERAPGYIGEMLNGIFIHHMLTVENVTIGQNTYPLQTALSNGLLNNDRIDFFTVY